MIEKIQKDIQTKLQQYNQALVDMKPQGMLRWGYEKFDNQFAITTSFGIQSSVLLDMVNKLSLQKKNQNILDRYRLPSSRNIPLR